MAAKPLRPYQSAAVEATIAHAKAGRRRICIAAPCGAGKTRIGVEICSRARGKGSHVLWLTHRQELIRQSRRALQNEGVQAGIIAPWAPRTFERIEVASIQTLTARDMRPDADLLILDEAHHFASEEWVQVIQSYPKAVVVGLTATPSRSDGIGLGVIFNALVPVCQPKDLIATGNLVPATVLGPSTAVSNLAAYPVDFYRQHCDGRKAVVFCSTIKEARDLAGLFTLAGIPAGCIDSQMEDLERERVLEQYATGAAKVLTSVNVFLEGWDAPDTYAVILARRFGSELAYIQATGRAMRSFPGKTRCIVGDLYGSSHGLGILPASDRVYSLDGKGVAATKDTLTEITQCKQCGEWFPAGVFAGGRCPGCGWVKPSKPDPRVVHQEMIELQFERLSRPTDAAKVEWLSGQLARQRGRTGGILGGFFRQFHCYPNTAQRERSGFERCRREERFARERKTA